MFEFNRFNFTFQIIRFTETIMLLKFVMSEREKQQLVHERETFNLNRHSKLTDKSSCGCVKRPCEASIPVIADQLVSISENEQKMLYAKKKLKMIEMGEKFDT